jgi:hypothetical protein
MAADARFNMAAAQNTMAQPPDAARRLDIGTSRAAVPLAV